MILRNWTNYTYLSFLHGIFTAYVISDRMSRKCEAVFSTEETNQLIQSFDDGLDSVSKEKAQAIKDTALKFNKSEQEIRVSTHAHFIHEHM